MNGWSFDYVFLAHPRAANETYCQHAWEALKIAGLNVVSAAACTLHAVVPCLCQTTASSIAQSIVDSVAARHAATRHADEVNHGLNQDKDKQE